MHWEYHIKIWVFICSNWISKSFEFYHNFCDRSVVEFWESFCS